MKNHPSVAKQRSGKEHGFPKRKTTLPAVDSPDKKQRVDEDTDMFDLKDAGNAILMPVHGIHTRRIKTVRKDDRRRNRVITQPGGVPHRNERVESGQHTPYERFYLSSGLSIPTYVFDPQIFQNNGVLTSTIAQPKKLYWKKWVFRTNQGKKWNVLTEFCMSNIKICRLLLSALDHSPEGRENMS